MDITSINNLKKRTKLNLYLNDKNLYIQNALKMRKTHLSLFNSKIKANNEFKEKHPLPKKLYSTSEINFKNTKNKIIDKFNIKNSVQDLMKIVNNFTDNLSFDDDLIIKTDKDELASMPLEKKTSKVKNKTKRKRNKKRINKDFFITNKYNKTEEKWDNAYKEKKSNFKNNLFFENYGKFKFTKDGILYPKKLKKLELPIYEGNSSEEKKYYEYRKKISFPEQEYNKLDYFSEKFNRDLGKISVNYASNSSRTRFTENPLLKKYMDMIPIYDIYKGLKEIENRYIGTKYKFKLLPLYNKKITNLDRLADRFYKTQYSKDGLINLLKIQNNKK